MSAVIDSNAFNPENTATTQVMPRKPTDNTGAFLPEKPCILIIDDQYAIRQICEMALEQAGYEVVLAEDGFVALEIIEKRDDIAMALCDILMPGLNGLVVLEKIKQMKPHIEVIIMTANGTIEKAVESMKLGAYDFILKPLKRDEIRMTVEKCLEKIRLSNENLELRRANKLLRDVQEMKEKFLAITSHELRTPFTHIRGYFSLLSAASASDLSKEERDLYNSVIRNSLAQMQDILDNMFDMVRLRGNQMHLSPEKLQIRDMLEQCVTEFQLRARKRQISLQLLPSAQNLVLFADRLRLKSVVSELIANAIKYTSEGGSIEIGCRQDDTYGIITCKDTGIGIASAEQVKIFERFYEVQASGLHSTNSNAFKGGGMGLGLALSKEIVQAHHGAIHVESELGKCRISGVLALKKVKCPDLNGSRVYSDRR